MHAVKSVTLIGDEPCVGFIQTSQGKSARTQAGQLGSVILSLPHLRIVSDTDECVEWVGRRQRQGYGVVKLNGRERRAHRLIWEWANGRSVPVGLFVRHRCDNPSCVNPRHLEVGSAKENSTDMSSRGRTYRPIGETHHMAKLSAADVSQIRKLSRDQREEPMYLAKQFGVSPSQIRRILRGQHWKHVS